jgi:hypothetical protein
MNVDAELLAKIRANAVLAIEGFGDLRGAAFGYDEGSVAWMEQLIDRRREQKEEVDNLLDIIGSYLGEAIIANAGGRWIEDDKGGLGVQFTNGDIVYPFNKVQKFFDNGLVGGDSIVSFYNLSINAIATGKLRKQAP